MPDYKDSPLFTHIDYLHAPGATAREHAMAERVVGAAESLLIRRGVAPELASKAQQLLAIDSVLNAEVKEIVATLASDGF